MNERRRRGLLALSLALSGALIGACGSPATDAGGNGGDAGGSDGGAATDAAEPPPPADLAPLLGPIRDAHALPALAAAVVASGELVALGAVGLRSAADTVPVTVDDRFHLGSCTKAMTATVAADLVEAGIMSWDMTLADAFPELVVDPGFAGVTFEHLFAHRAGLIGDLGAEPALWNTLWDFAVDPVVHRAWLAEQLLERPPDFPPDVTYVYSNAGYIVAGAAMERATGESWETLIQDRLFTPLGMGSCGFGAPATPPFMVDQPWGHTVNGVDVEPVAPGPYADNPPALGPAGTVHCSLADWAKFAALHVAGARGEPTILEPDSFTRMHTPWPGGDYALGWGVADRTWAGGLALNHAGSNTMFYAVVWLAPEKDRAMLVATNRADLEAQLAVEEAFVAMIPVWIP